MIRMDGRLGRSPSRWYALAFLLVIASLVALVLFGRVVYVEETDYVTAPGTQIAVQQDGQELGTIALWDWVYDPETGAMQVFLGKGIGVPADYFADGNMDLVAFVKHGDGTNPTVENVYEDADSAVLEVTGIPEKFGALALDLTPHGATRETNPDVLFERRKQAFSGEKTEEDETDETTRLFTSDGIVKHVDALDADADAFRERTHDRLVSELEWRIESYEEAIVNLLYENEELAKRNAQLDTQRANKSEEELREIDSKINQNTTRTTTNELQIEEHEKALDVTRERLESLTN